MSTFTLRNNMLGLTVTVQAKDKYFAKCKASDAHRATYPDVKGSPNSPFHWCLVSAQAGTLNRID